jgi:ABC-type multidrug transport system fused ATPase/permease subunit
MSTFALVVIIIMFFYDIVTTIIAVALVIPGALVAPFYTKINRQLTQVHQRARAKANASAEESIANIRTVKAFAEEKAQHKKFADLNQEVYKVAYKKHTKWAQSMFWNKLLTASALAGLILYVGKQVELGNLDVG